MSTSDNNVANNTNAIVWFRRDLRISDNEALTNALKDSIKPICVYIYNPEEESPWVIGSASKWWLHHALEDLQNSLLSINLDLLFYTGDSLSVLESIVKTTSASKIYWNRMYDPETVLRDTNIKTYFEKQGIEVQSSKGSLLKEPWEIKNGSGKPYQVFTPFWKTLSKELVVDVKKSFKEKPPRKAEIPLENKKIDPDSLSNLTLQDLKLLPTISWDANFYDLWKPTENAAWDIISNFVHNSIDTYQTDRDIPSLDATSKLSPYLHFGQITPSAIWNFVSDAFEYKKAVFIEPFLRQLAWRDFAHHLLFHFPHTNHKPLKEDFEKFPWREVSKKASSASADLKAWQKGQTGIPILDAGMRELWHTGTMHNRVRMLVGSFLVKNLRIHWLQGAKWFWDTLLDADLANNSLGWQWIAGCGADAAPYFRVFNPVSQSEKFDAEGLYIRKWVPELSKLPDKWLSKPWEAPHEILMSSGVILGKTYPFPICDLKETREEALNAYYEMKKNT